MRDAIRLMREALSLMRKAIGLMREAIRLMRGAVGPLTSAVAAAGSVQRAHSARPAMRHSGSDGDRTYLMREAISLMREA